MEGVGEQKCVRIIYKNRIPEQFYDEICQKLKILKSLNHPNVVKIHETYEEDLFFFVVQDLCLGGELLTMALQEQSYSEQFVAFIIRQILSGLYYCHKKEVILGRIQPSSLKFLEPKSKGQSLRDTIL